MSEADFWTEIRVAIGDYGHFSRVESPETSPGIPDLDFCIDGVEGHIELKYGDTTKTPKIRPTQVRWFRDRVNNGGRPWLFVLLVTGKAKHYLLFHGAQVPSLSRVNHLLWDGYTIHHWVDKMDWKDFISILCSKRK